jgi:hypothetical protein
MPACRLQWQLGLGLWFLFRQRARLGRNPPVACHFAGMADGLIVQDPLGAVRFINRAASQM